MQIEVSRQELLGYTSGSSILEAPTDCHPGAVYKAQNTEHGREPSVNLTIERLDALQVCPGIWYSKNGSRMIKDDQVHDRSERYYGSFMANPGIPNLKRQKRDVSANHII